MNNRCQNIFHIFYIIMLAAAILVFPIHANANTCGREFKKEIKDLGILEERIEGFSTTNIYDMGESGGGTLRRVEGWVSFKDCRGNLIINLTEICTLQSNYTTHECSVDGVENY